MEARFEEVLKTWVWLDANLDIVSFGHPNHLRIHRWDSSIEPAGYIRGVDVLNRFFV